MRCYRPECESKNLIFKKKESQYINGDIEEEGFYTCLDCGTLVSGYTRKVKLER